MGDSKITKLPDTNKTVSDCAMYLFKRQNVKLTGVYADSYKEACKRAINIDKVIGYGKG